MKVCKYCDTCYDDGETKCPSCYATEYSHKCNNCGKVFDSVFCPDCGIKFDDKGKTCPRCGRVYYTPCCPDCGYSAASGNNYTNRSTNSSSGEYVSYKAVKPPVTEGEYTSTVSVQTGKRINKWVAFLLCLIFGYWGIHKFYEGKIFAGVIYFLTFGLVGIGWIIDIFIILFKPDPYYVK